MHARKTIIPFSLTALVFISAVSHAATSQASLKLDGEILPASCDMAIENGGTIRLGKPSPVAAPSEQGYFALPERTIGINIQCPGSTSFGIRTTDITSNAGQIRLDGAEINTVFSLGETAKGEAIGGYSAIIDKSRSLIDGKPLEKIIVSQDQGNSWQSTQGHLTSQGKSVYSWGEQSRPLNAKTVKLGLTISPFLLKNNYSDAVKIDGITSFELVYL